MKNKKMNMLAQQALDDLDVIMRTENGRRFVHAILESTEVETAVFSAEPYFNAFLSGKRAVGVDLLKNIRMLNDGHSLEMLMRNEAESARHPPDLEDDDLFKVDNDIAEVRHE